MSTSQHWGSTEDPRVRHESSIAIASRASWLHEVLWERTLIDRPDQGQTLRAWQWHVGRSCSGGMRSWTD